jgi:PleD family two-component response regulator
MQQHLLETKITQINRELADTQDGLPATSISAGIVHGSPEKDSDTLMREADKALYETKKHGKRGYTFV